MRYAQAGGYTPAEQARRERVRFAAAEWFARGAGVGEVAAEFRVTERSVARWRAAWESKGLDGLRSQGPVSVERLTPRMWARLESELGKGPAAHGFADDQRWTLARVKTLIGRLFHRFYTIQGVAKLLRRHGWSCQVPVRRAVERDEEAIEVWKKEVWPVVERSRSTWAPTSASRTRPARD